MKVRSDVQMFQKGGRREESEATYIPTMHKKRSQLSSGTFWLGVQLVSSRRPM